jgi:hypothetical protein
VVERQTVHRLRELFALLRDEPHARRLAAWVFPPPGGL